MERLGVTAGAEYGVRIAVMNAIELRFSALRLQLV